MAARPRRKMCLRCLAGSGGCAYRLRNQYIETQRITIHHKKSIAWDKFVRHQDNMEVQLSDTHEKKKGRHPDTFCASDAQRKINARKKQRSRAE